MANIKITQLAATTDPASTDVLPIVDVSADTTNKVSVADLLESAGDGTASAPGISFDSDNDTGIYRAAANELGISTGGTQRVVVNSSGNVGIGTTAPTYKFDCRGEGAFELFNTSGGGNVLNFRPSLEDANKFNMSISSYDHSGGGVGNADGLSINSFDGLSVCTGSSTTRNEKLRITEAGKVGVGTTSVAGTNTQLEVAGGTATEIKISSASANNANFRGLRFGITGDSNDYSGVLFKPNTAELRLEAGYSGFGGFQTLYTNGSERVRLDSSGDIGVGSTTPNKNNWNKAITLEGSSNCAYELSDNGTLAAAFALQGSDRIELINFRSGPLTFKTDNTERLRIDSSGRLLVGTSSARTMSTTIVPSLQAEGTSNNTSALALVQNNSSATIGASVTLAKTRATTKGGTTVVQSGENLGSIYFEGADGTNLVSAARIFAAVDGTPGANDMPGRLVFSTTADGASSPTEHFRIASNGDLTATDTTIGSNSDSRLKTNIANFAYDLETFKQYQPKTFDWKNPELHGNKTSQRGFIAQDVEAIDAYWVSQQAVDEDSADAEFLDADRLAKTLKLDKKDAMYVSVIQQLLAKIETLEAKVAALEAE